MTTTSKTLLVALAILGGASLLVSQTAGPPQLRIKFTGICDFVPQPGGGLHVLLPDLNNAGGRAHRGFIRVRRNDVRSNAPSNFDRNSGTDGALILKGVTISLSGPFQPTPLKIEPSYLTLVPDMRGLGAVLASKPGPLVADMQLDKGTLEAFAAKGQTVFLRPKARTPSNCRGARSLANVVELRLPLQQNAAGQSFAISAGPRKLTFDYTSSSDIEVWIGNAIDQQVFGSGTNPMASHGQDTDFLFHYRLAQGGPNSAGVVLPTTCGVRTLTMWEPCYVARWGQ